MNNTSYTTTTFCRKCYKLRSCLDTHNLSNYRYLCKECAGEEKLVVNCISCGREGTTNMLKHGGYCHLCEHKNIVECPLCGAEVYKSMTIEGICHKCVSGENKECTKCGGYFASKTVSNNGLCAKCNIKVHRSLKRANKNEIVECIECGREILVNDTNNNGLCIYCNSKELEGQIQKLKKRKKAYY